MSEIEQIVQSHIRYNIQPDGVEWLNIYWSGQREWSHDLNACLARMKTPTKAFILAMILYKIYSNLPSYTSDLAIAIYRLVHAGGCLYDSLNTSDIYSTTDLLINALAPYDIDVEREYTIHGKYYFKFILGKKYTVGYRRKLVTIWRMEGLI